jgi:RsiW-degrading membrane proteinase PrsW (M82 family)
MPWPLTFNKMIFTLKQIIVLGFAIVPALIWLWFFLGQSRQNKLLVLLTFIGGMIAAKIILIYQGYWDTTVNLIFFKVSLVDFRTNIETIVVNALFATFVIFLGVGVMEEVAKFIIMRFINKNSFRSIDDVIQLAIASALGFAFFENVLYFANHYSQLSAGGFFGFALFRVTVVTMVHMLCSGVLGYYYGMAFFASPILMIQTMKKKRHPILQFLKTVLHMKRSGVYHDEMLVLGLLLSMFLHALYDFTLSFTEATFAGIPVYLPIMFLYFFGGFAFLRYLLQKKDHNLKLGLVGTTMMPKEDFQKLIAEIQEIKQKMRSDIESQEEAT